MIVGGHSSSRPLEVTDYLTAGLVYLCEKVLERRDETVPSREYFDCWGACWHGMAWLECSAGCCNVLVGRSPVLLECPGAPRVR